MVNQPAVAQDTPVFVTSEDTLIPVAITCAGWNLSAIAHVPNQEGVECL